MAQAREIIHAASHVHFFTGAGMSADSGLDTFRDARTGLWERVNPQDMASLEAWQRDPGPMWAWYLWRAHLRKRLSHMLGTRQLLTYPAQCLLQPKTLMTCTNEPDPAMLRIFTDRFSLFDAPPATFPTRRI